MRPRRSTVPACVPACFLRRFFLVWAMRAIGGIRSERNASSIVGPVPSSPGSARREGTLRAQPSGTSPTISASATGAASPDPGDHVAERDRHRVVDVGRDLRPARGRRGTGRWRARLAGRLPIRGGPPRSRCARSRSSVQVQVEGGERRAGSDEGGADPGVDLARAEVGRKLTGRDPGAQLGRGPRAGGLRARCLPSPVASRRRGRPGGPAPSRAVPPLSAPRHWAAPRSCGRR